MFLPVQKSKSTDTFDVILVSGDAYIDSYFNGIVLIGKYLVSKGFSVGLIAQPDLTTDDIAKLGEPNLFWGVSAGCVDSMVANYTASGKPRKSCDNTPGGINNKRPDRATIVYTGLIRKFFKKTKPIVLGGVEASLRRITHYDSTKDKVKRSVLFDAKADIIVYGNGEVAIIELAKALQAGEEWRNIKGICYISKEKPENSVELPEFIDVYNDKVKFTEMFKIFYENAQKINNERLHQKTDERYWVQNPQSILTSEVLDEVSELDYERAVHPSHKGEVRALETIRFSINSHRGCFGSCAFCAITIHQGRNIVSRSEESILREVRKMSKLKGFNGIISDIGGATANMYKMSCPKLEKIGGCLDKNCLFPNVCHSMNVSHEPLINLLDKVSKVDGVKKVFASSGIRADVAMADSKFGKAYIEKIAASHVSGQLKLAPESADDYVLSVMKKPNLDTLLQFVKIYEVASRKANKNQFMSYYFMVAHPGCDDTAMRNTYNFIREHFKFMPEQVQIFTPTPSTWATCMYYTNFDENGRYLYVEKNVAKKEKQKSLIISNKK